MSCTNLTREEADLRGYCHPGYVASLAEFGQPRFLPKCEGWILTREIPGSAKRDAMGPYPIFTCRNWDALPADLELIDAGLVSLVLVTDPFARVSPETLERAFPDLMTSFKEHFVTGLDNENPSVITSHHRYYARKALSQVHVEVYPRPAEVLDEWLQLYDELTRRHVLAGIKAFSRAAFAAQLEVPGMVLFRARQDDATVGMHLWYQDGERAYSHLTALSAKGYELMASYALCWKALNFFAASARWLDWGAGAGGAADARDGLSQFKRGWATETRPVFLCGRVFDRGTYDRLCARSLAFDSKYFPAYRSGELCEGTEKHG